MKIKASRKEQFYNYKKKKKKKKKTLWLKGLNYKLKNKKINSTYVSTSY